MRRINIKADNRTSGSELDDAPNTLNGSQRTWFVPLMSPFISHHAPIMSRVVSASFPSAEQGTFGTKLTFQAGRGLSGVAKQY